VELGRAIELHAAFPEESCTSLLFECRAQEIQGSHVAFRGFLPRKSTPRGLYETTVIAKPLYAHISFLICHSETSEHHNRQCL
jgi:hypothetical protein